MVPTVTSVKLPAALRAGIYRERPCDEQALWWSRIAAAKTSDDFVATALAETGAPARYSSTPPPSLQDGSTTAVERHRLRRTFKGLENPVDEQ
jgi:hypothetical protein